MEDNKIKNEKKQETKGSILSKLLLKKEDVIVCGILLCVVLIILLSPKMYWVTTAKWTNWDENDRNMVLTAMSEENTKERFRLYFQYYNVIHELGHGLINYNNGVDIPIAEEEQLVNDFAVAYWNYYGEPEKMKELYDIVTYAVENVGDNYQNGVNYMENAKKHSKGKQFDNDFFNFNDYGWFQYCCVKHSIEQNKTLEEVLKEMGFKDFKLTEKKLLVYEKIDEDVSTLIINEAVKNFNEWGFYFPKAYQLFSNDPNMNMSRPFKNFLGIFNLFNK